MKTPETMSKAEVCCMLYFETCAVDHGGLVEGCRMNEADHRAAETFRAAGLAELYRIPSHLRGLDECLRYTHWVHLTDAGLAVAHALRAYRAKKRRVDFAELVVDDLIDSGKLIAARSNSCEL